MVVMAAKRISRLTLKKYKVCADRPCRRISVATSLVVVCHVAGMLFCMYLKKKIKWQNTCALKDSLKTNT